jgi:hypothetical protein
MSAPKPDPATVAFEALALDALRRTSRTGDTHASDDAPTQLYVRARSTRTRSPLQTMTVRAVAALSHAKPSARRVRRPIRQHDPRASRRWLLALAGAVLAGCAAAALTAALLASRPGRGSTAAARASDVAPSRQTSTAVPARSVATPRTASTAVPAELIAAAPTPPAVPIARPTHAIRGRREPSATTASAVAALAAGDYRDALARYRQLAAREPEQPVFAAIVRLLERDLARSCDPALASTGGECGR